MVKLRPSKEEIASAKRQLMEVGSDISDEMIEECLIMAKLPESAIKVLVALGQNGLSLMDVIDRFERGMDPEAVAEEMFYDDEVDEHEEVTEFLAAMRMIYKLLEQIGTSTKILQGRGISQSTKNLRDAILRAFEDTDKPVTVGKCSICLALQARSKSKKPVTTKLSVSCS